MGTRTAANSLVKRTTFSSAINIFPPEVTKNDLDSSISSNNNSTRPYSEIPGPKELPLIGNSWRFAPIIGELNNSYFNQCHSFNSTARIYRDQIDIAAFSVQSVCSTRLYLFSFRVMRCMRGCGNRFLILLNCNRFRIIVLVFFACSIQVNPLSAPMTLTSTSHAK